MLRYKTETRPGLVALYDIRPGNGAGQFLQPQSPHGAKPSVSKHWRRYGGHKARTIPLIQLQSNINAEAHVKIPNAAAVLSRGKHRCTCQTNAASAERQHCQQSASVLELLHQLCIETTSGVSTTAGAPCVTITLSWNFHQHTSSASLNNSRS